MYSSEPFAVIATLVTHDDILLSSSLTAGEGSPVLKLTTEARSRGYQSVCIPLTTEKWKARWTDTCLLPPDYDPSAPVGVNADHRAELWRSNPAFGIGEVTMTRLGVSNQIPRFTC
jgi:type II protein arginine methyltransferase